MLRTSLKRFSKNACRSKCRPACVTQPRWQCGWQLFVRSTTSNKLAHVSRIPLTEEQGLELLNPVQALAGCAEHGVQAVPGKPDTFQGKQGSSAIGLSSNSDLLVTVDPTSGLPTQITIVDPNREHGWEVMLDRFHWNVPIDGAFLSLEPPQGYELTSDPIFGGPPSAPNASTATDEP